MATILLGERPNSPKCVVNNEDLYLGSRTYVREFLVRASSLADDALTVCSTGGLPRIYEPYLFGTTRDQYALARKIEAERLTAGSTDWIVRVDYRTLNKSELQGQYENPLLQLPEVETAVEKFQEPVFAVYDLTTQELTPCRNSAGQVFDPPPMRDNSRLVLTITRNESISVLHPAVDLQYTDAVNADVFWGCLPGTWKCQGITTRREVKQLQSGIRFPHLRCTYRFEARPIGGERVGWDTRILDAGAYYHQTAATTSVSLPQTFGPGEAAITPGSMTSIAVNTIVQADSGEGRKEYARVTAVTATTFTANFRLKHGPGGVVLNVVRRLTFLADDGSPRVGLLDGDGMALAEGKNPVFRTFRFYPRIPFGPLRLPQSFASVA